MAVFLAGCASKLSVGNVEWQKDVIAPKTIVLMPVRNKSGQSEGVEFVERVVPETLRGKGYEVVDRGDTVKSLSAIGIATTEQVWSVPVSKMLGSIKADGMLFVSIEQWGKNFELSWTDARVTLVYVLYDKNGKKLWSWRQTVFTEPGSSLPSTTGDIVSDVVIQMASAAFGHSLTSVERLAVQANDLALNSGKNPLPNYR